MNHDAILTPMAAQVALTFVVLLQVPICRFRAAFAGKVVPDDFKFGESANVPTDVGIPNRNLMNLLEMPMLFYVACVTLYVTDAVDRRALALAWTYVALRAAHSLVHLTYNTVVHRLSLFTASNVVLAIVWTRWFIAH